MATFFVFASNWNDPAFWSGINVSTSGHELDLSNLPSQFTADFDADDGRLTISDGATSFVVGDASHSGASDVVLGGGTGFSQMSSFLGPMGASTLEGTVSNDSIIGGEAEDAIVGGDGGDTLRGGMGEDTIEGGLGDDSIVGNEEADSLKGDAGSDSLYGEYGDDTVEGGAGDDTVEGNEGNDLLIGGTGNDWMRGSYDNDTLYGGEGDDYLWGGFGDDLFVIENNFGNDTIDAEGIAETDGDTLDLRGVTDDLIVDLTDANPENGSFRDNVFSASFNEIETILLGSGTDTIVLSDGSGADKVSAFTVPIMNGDGSYSSGDMLDVSGMTSDGSTPVTTADVSLSDTVGDGSGDAMLVFPGGESLTLTGVNVSQLNGSEILNAMGIPLPGGGTVGADALTGTVDADVIHAGGGDDQIDGGQGNDTVLAGSGDDLVAGGAGHDQLDGGLGADTLAGGQGDDTLTGGAGQDVFDLADGDGADLVMDFVIGTDELDVSDLTDANGAPVNVADVVVTDTNGDGTGDAILTFPGGESLTLTDVSAQDLDTPGKLAAIGIPAQPELVATTKGDILEGTADDEAIDGLTGGDHLSGLGGQDTLLGGDGHDTLIGGADDDVLSGGRGNDDLQGGSGADTLTGGKGDDLLAGGADADLFMLAGGRSGNDTISDFVQGEDLLDLRVYGVTDLSDLTLSDGPAGVVIDIASKSTLTLTGLSASDLTPADFVFGPAPSITPVSETQLTDSSDFHDAGRGRDAIDGADGDDTILGRSGADSLSGGQGDDSLSGGTANDQLLGEDGADTLDGGRKNDTLDGGNGQDVLLLGYGNDELSGGADADLFAKVHGGTGDDTITDFELGTDMIDLSGSTITDLSQMSIADSSGSAVITFADGSTLELTGVSADALDAGAFLLATPQAPGARFLGMVDETDLSGGREDGQEDQADQAEVLTGGLDKDTILGAGGDDVIHGEAGRDLLLGGAGNDTLDGGSGNDLMSGQDGDDDFFGGNGRDTLWGDDGEDTLTGGQGDDYLQGGADADTFRVISARSGDDTIADFVQGEDQIDLSELGVSSLADLVISDQDGTAVIDLGTDASLSLTNFDATSLTASDFVLAAPAGPALPGDLSAMASEVSLAQTLVGFELPVQNEDGSWTPGDVLDLTGFETLDGDPVTSDDVAISSANPDGSGDAVLTFPQGQVFVLDNIDMSQIADLDVLEQMGLPPSVTDLDDPDEDYPEIMVTLLSKSEQPDDQSDPSDLAQAVDTHPEDPIDSLA